MASDVNRVLRGASVGALSAIVTAAAHGAGGGARPSEAGCLLLIVVCAAIGRAAASMPEISRPRLMGALAAAQAFGHLVLSAMTAHPHSGTADGRMLWAHLVAVVAGAYLIGAAERGSRWAVSTLRRVVPGPDPVPIDRPLGLPVTVYRVTRTPRLVDLSGTGTRGPPFAT
ncbi:hypothetical protein [Nocardia flavorosea]|uniref:Uncharacterized protein n=1 Tax=Nocardia flavorosea TaxID=53429 RepID=A0A846YIJ6_9NOCA|nr:hypothetical protein [Nocardia flavorosea]NKY57490.1 hypothetical protein [Nocardia flavorosea]